MYYKCGGEGEGSKDLKDCILKQEGKTLAQSRRFWNENVNEISVLRLTDL